MTKPQPKGMRVIIDKEWYKKLKIYCIQHNITVSDVMRNHVYSLVKKDLIEENETKQHIEDRQF